MMDSGFLTAVCPKWTTSAFVVKLSKSPDTEALEIDLRRWLNPNPGRYFDGKNAHLVSEHVDAHMRMCAHVHRDSYPATMHLF